MAELEDEKIGIVDTWLLHQFHWPIQRIFARHAVDQLELERYMKELLTTGRWDTVRVTPVHDADGHPSDHLYKIFGHPSRAAGRTTAPHGGLTPRTGALVTSSA